MADTPTDTAPARKTTRRTAAQPKPGTAGNAAEETISKAQKSAERITNETLEGLKSAQDAAEKAAEKLREMIETNQKATEEAIAEATRQLADRAKAAQDAADELPRRLEEQLKKAESESKKLTDAATSTARANVEAAQKAADEMRKAVAEQVEAAQKASASATQQVSEMVQTRLADTQKLAGAHPDDAERNAAAMVAPADALQGAGIAGNVMFENMARAQSQLASFMSDRIRQDMEMQRDLLACRTFEDFQKVQQNFFENAMSEYTSMAQRLFNMGDSFTPGALSSDKK